METQDAFEDEWFKTGDICRIEDNFLIFVKEKKNTGKIKGNMIDLDEVKRAMLMYPKIKDVSIDCRNNILSAMVKINSNINFNKEILEVKKFLEPKIAMYKIPQVIIKI